MARIPLVTEAELLSATVTEGGDLTFLRENGQLINAGRVRGDLTPEAEQARNVAVAARDDAVAAAQQAQLIAMADAAVAWGFYPVFSDTPPVQSEMFGVPVVWMSPTGLLTDIPAWPTEPLWDHVEQTFTVAETTGVQWMFDGDVVTPGVAVPVSTIPSTVTVEAVALPGYSMAAPAVFTEYFYDPDDVSLLASESFFGTATLTIVGREADMFDGGSLTAPTWVYDHSSRDGATLGIDGDGFLIGTIEGSDTWSTKANIDRMLNLGTLNQRVEMLVEEMPNNGTFGVALGTNIGLARRGGLLLTLTKGSGGYTFNVTGSAANGGTVNLTGNVAITDVAGTWVFDHIADAKAWSVTAPDDTVLYGMYETSDVSDPDKMDARYIGVTGSTLLSLRRGNTDTGIKVNNLRIFQIGGA